MRSILLIILSGITVHIFYSCSTKASPGNQIDRRITITPDSLYAISAVINDESDPTWRQGIDFNVWEDISPIGDLRVTATSSNTSVVPNTNLIISGSGITRNLKIIPVTPGYSVITITVSEGAHRISYVLNYAASDATVTADKRWHAGIADASAAVVIDDDYMVVANDESNCLYLYDRNNSGRPIKIFNYNQNNVLGLSDSSSGKWKEVDVEGAEKSFNDPSLYYWMGSMSNNSSFIDKPNRNRLFAITVSGKGADINFANAGYYDKLRQELISWGNANGYDFTSSAANGKDPKQVDGFNLEGMVFGPDKKTMFICFRAPLVPIAKRTKALIAPILNFESWFNNVKQGGKPIIGAPIELDLDGRGIRDIIRLSNDNYLIIAGSSTVALTPAAYTWTGNPTDVPLKINSVDLTGLNVEGVIPVYKNGQPLMNKFQVLTDNGTELYYCDTIPAKDLSFDNFKKFSSVICTYK